MKQPIISDLDGVTQGMIDSLEIWLEEGWYDNCPSFGFMCNPPKLTCCKLFDNLKDPEYTCPCSIYGKEATILAFTIICDVWKVYHKEAT